MALGGFLSFICLFLMNIINKQGIHDSGPRAAVNSIVCAGTCAMFTMFIHQNITYLTKGKQSKTNQLTIINGALSGMVSK